MREGGVRGFPLARGFPSLSEHHNTPPLSAQRAHTPSSPPIVIINIAVSGSALLTVPAAIKNPGVLYKIVGSAMPASSNFFIAYLQTQALLMVSRKRERERERAREREVATGGKE
jgi:hypothetical protein